MKLDENGDLVAVETEKSAVAGTVVTPAQVETARQ
jgi:hypothetical protein